MQTILFTGGGSAGHVTPNIALITKCLAAGWKVSYAGSKKGIESDIINRIQIPYYAISTGKLRRYFSWRTLIEPIVIMQGIIEAFFLCRRLKPSVIFSKGGFVAFPIVVGGWLNRIPIIIHESDLTPGLANKLSFPFANRICVTFPEGRRYTPAKNSIVTGTPIRETLLKGNGEKGKALCGFDSHDPILLFLGGGQGSAMINQTVRSLLPTLRQSFQIVHLCGAGKVDHTLDGDSRYKQFDYLNEELADVLACADLVISRAGANTLYELLRLKKLHILIPLSKRASRGDQIANAHFFAQKGLSYVLEEQDLNAESLNRLIHQVFADKTGYQARLINFSLPDSNQLIYKEILQLSNQVT